MSTVAGMVRVRNLLDERGAKLHEVSGWSTRGRGSLAVKGTIIHHTAGSARGEAPSYNVILNGRAGLPGPLSNFYIDRSGKIYFVAAGRTNHAGRGRYAGISSGNSNFLGIEVEDPGVAAEWPAPVYQAAIQLCAAIRDVFGGYLIGHKEWTSRKIDPRFSMPAFRLAVENSRSSGVSVFIPEEASVLRRGDSGKKVEQLQHLLALWLGGLVADGDFGPATEKALIVAQKKLGLTPDGIYGPATRNAFMRYKAWWAAARIPS